MFQANVPTKAAIEGLKVSGYVPSWEGYIVVRWCTLSRFQVSVDD